jgi:hypothetical protein
VCFCFVKLADSTQASVYNIRSSELEGILSSPFLFVIETESQEAVMWLGWLFTLVISQLIVWPVAWCLAKLPLLNLVL